MSLLCNLNPIGGKLMSSEEEEHLPPWATKTETNVYNSTTEDTKSVPPSSNKQEKRFVKEPNQSTRLLSPPKEPSKGCFLSTIIFLKILTIIVSIVFIVSQSLAIFLETDLTVTELLIRIYGTLFGLSIIPIEVGWPNFITETALFKSWIFRGIAYGFVGILALEEAEEGHYTGKIHDFLEYIGFFVSGIGLLYFLMGCFCLKSLHERLQNEYLDLFARSVLARQIFEENFGSV